MRRHVPLVVAALTCPCHLPLLAALLAGTVVGGVIANNLAVLFTVFGLLFVGSLWLWSRQSTGAPSAPSPAPLPALGPSGQAGAAEPLRVQVLTTLGCASCAGVERGWEALRPQYGGRVQVEVADLLEQPELARRYGVLRSPAVVIDGRLRAQGALDAPRLRRLLDEALRERRAAVRTEEDAYA